ncbi:S8 family peptidase [Haladaptatus caseinilyticus]|uniref:S8 family peptidase n=1 Tax=Haladaptatus caseinilyticus TaxID=2993314 RepID=UPI00224B4B3B|nr:S8 family serine peptidase [Haladaptatus caseinilyticus]
MNLQAKRRTLLKGIAATTVGLAATTSGNAAEEETYLVTTGSDKVAQKLERKGYIVQNEIPAANLLIVRGPSSETQSIQDISGVREAAPDLAYEIGSSPVDSMAPSVDAQYTDLQWDKQLTDAFAAHDFATGAGTRVAVVDTGVDHTHPDLSANVNTDLGRSVIDGEFGPDASPVHPHGTHVAGIAAATGAQGVVGMAPDAELVPLRVFPKEGPVIERISDCLLAIDYAAQIGADVVNMSLGWEPRPPRENQTAQGVRRVICDRVIKSVRRRGTTVVVSGGNEETDLQHGGYRDMWTSLESTLGVSATAPNDELAFYSNYGLGDIDVGAPGGGYETIEKTLSNDTEWPNPTNRILSTVPNDSYAYYIGTSMASPQVAGLVSLVRELSPTLKPNRIEGVIKRNAEGSNGRSDPELGAGRINALQTVESLLK